MARQLSISMVSEHFETRIEGHGLVRTQNKAARPPFIAGPIRSGRAARPGLRMLTTGTIPPCGLVPRAIFPIALFNSRKTSSLVHRSRSAVKSMYLGASSWRRWSISSNSLTVSVSSKLKVTLVANPPWAIEVPRRGSCEVSSFMLGGGPCAG